jgi:hypothetical protein
MYRQGVCQSHVTKAQVFFLPLCCF